MSIDRGHGIATSSVLADSYDLDALIADTEAAKVAALAAQAAAEAVVDNFDDVYLGAKSSDPTVDNDGDALTAGDMYFNTTSDSMKVYNGSAWQVTEVDLSGVLATSGGTMTGDLSLGDNVKAKFGASDDLQIYHDGNDSYIDEAGSGILFINTNGTKIKLQGSGETLAEFIDDGANNFYHNGSQKLATTSTGIDVTGNVTATSFSGDGSNLTGLPAGGISGSQLFTSSGTWDWNAAGQPSTVYVTVVGGGGGGGGWNSSGTAYAGGGGGGGGTSIGTVAVTGNVSVVVGAGGSYGGMNNDGSTGGTSSFSSVSASGGAGGPRRTSTTNTGVGGAGGAGTFQNGGRGGYRYSGAISTPSGSSYYSTEEDTVWYSSYTSRCMVGYGTGGFGRSYWWDGTRYESISGTAGFVLVTW